MPCKTTKSMRFKVYTISPLPQRMNGNPIPSIHDPQYHHDTGKEFTITSPDDTLPYWKARDEEDRTARDRGITEYSIAAVMFEKVYGFNGRFVSGWYVDWEPNSYETYMNGNINNHWYIKRIV